MRCSPPLHQLTFRSLERDSSGLIPRGRFGEYRCQLTETKGTVTKIGEQANRMLINKVCSLLEVNGTALAVLRVRKETRSRCMDAEV
jgi:hypothetical protein